MNGRQEKVIKPRYRLSELEAMPTILQGQAENLKIKEPNFQVWLSRMTRKDGEPFDNKVTVEEYKGKGWKVIDVYQAKD